MASSPLDVAPCYSAVSSRPRSRVSGTFSRHTCPAHTPAPDRLAGALACSCGLPHATATGLPNCASTLRCADPRQPEADSVSGPAWWGPPGTLKRVTPAGPAQDRHHRANMIGTPTRPPAGCDDRPPPLPKHSPTPAAQMPRPRPAASQDHQRLDRREHPPSAEAHRRRTPGDARRRISSGGREQDRAGEAAQSVGASRAVATRRAQRARLAATTGRRQDDATIVARHRSRRGAPGRRAQHRLRGEVHEPHGRHQAHHGDSSRVTSRRVPCSAAPDPPVLTPLAPAARACLRGSGPGPSPASSGRP